MLPNISPGPIPDKANADMAIGNSVDCDNLVQYFPDVLSSAKQNFEGFFDLRPGTSTQDQADCSSLGVAVGASANVCENQSVAQYRAYREVHDEFGGGGCCALGTHNFYSENVQVAKLIVALGGQ